MLLKIVLERPEVVNEGDETLGVDTYRACLWQTTVSPESMQQTVAELTCIWLLTAEPFSHFRSSLRMVHSFSAG